MLSLSPAFPSSAIPMELLQLNIYFYLDIQREKKTQNEKQTLCSQKGSVKKLCLLVITIRILGVILSSFYLLKISNHCHVNEKVLSSKAFLLVKSQILNKALSPKIRRSTKNIHTYGGPERRCYPLSTIHFFNSILSRDKRETC